MLMPVRRSSARCSALHRRAGASWRLAVCTTLMAVLVPARGDSATALEQSSAPASCDSPQHHQMDFWIGDWQVFDTETKQLVAFDRVEKQYEGCIIQETLAFLTDMYRRPGVKVRLSGIAVNRFDGERWLQ